MSLEERYAERRAEIERCFAEGRLLPDRREEYLSPSRRFRLRIDEYEYDSDWRDLSRGIVTRLADGAVVADVKRNDSRFPFAWVEHPNGDEYLICGEDYQSYSVVDLNTGATSTFISEDMLDGNEFCHVDFLPAPDGRTIAVDGCYWAAQYEVRFYDFADPHMMPLPLLGTIESHDDALGWVDNEFVSNTVRWCRPAEPA